MERSLIIDGDLLSEEAPSRAWESIQNVMLGPIDMGTQKFVLVEQTTKDRPPITEFVQSFKDKRLPNLAVANSFESDPDLIPDDWKEGEKIIVFMGTILVSNFGGGLEHFVALTFDENKDPLFTFSSDIGCRELVYYVVHFA